MIVGRELAIEMRVGIVRAACVIVLALVALVVFAGRDARAQVRVPTVTSIAPSGGPAAGGTSLTIAGTSFTGATAVRFGGTTATAFTVNSATSITATSPAGSGTVDVTVTNPSGSSAITAADQFTYVAAPTITSIAPNGGPAAGGTSVTITGTLFTGATAVRFGGTTATAFTVNSATSITATSPAGSGTVDVTVTNPVGTSAHNCGGPLLLCASSDHHNAVIVAKSIELWAIGDFHSKS